MSEHADRAITLGLLIAGAVMCLCGGGIAFIAFALPHEAGSADLETIIGVCGLVVAVAGLATVLRGLRSRQLQ